jgi:signal transduction histidine kinase/PAS domain-containing protein
MAGSGQLSIVWPGDDEPERGGFGDPALQGDPAVLAGLPGTTDGVLHRLCAAVPDLAPAISQLRTRGIGFDLLGAGWRVRGTPVGGQALLWAGALEPGALLQAMSGAPLAVWQLDPGGRLAWANAAYLSAVEAMTLGQAIEADALLDPQAKADGLRAIAGDPVSAVRQVTVGGQQRVWRISHLPMPGGAVGVGVDVSEEVEARDGFEREVTGYVESLNILTDAVALFGPRRKLRSANAAFAMLWGLDEEELAGRPTYGEILDTLRARDLLPPDKDIIGWKERQLAAFSQTGQMPDEMWILPGRTILRVARKRLPDGGLLVLFSDITGTAALQARYKTQLDVQTATLDKLTEAVGVFGSDGSLSLANAAFSELWELEPGLAGTQPGFGDLLERTLPLHRDEGFWTGLRARLTDPSPEARQETGGEFTRADLRVLAWFTRPLPDGATLVVFSDVTAARKVEASARASAAAFTQADRLKTDFLKNVSYQLRTPLTTISGYADLLSAGVGGQLSEAQQGFVGAMQSANSQLAEMIGSILDLSMIDAGQLTLDLGDVDVQAVLDEVAEHAAARRPEGDVAVNVVCSNDIGLIRADGHRLKQVMTTLSGIAMRAVGPGDAITLRADRFQDMVRLQVEDTGPGMDDLERAGAFRVFDEKARRGGISLSLVTRFIEMHGGWASVGARPGGGTLVTCRIPVQANLHHAQPELELLPA